MFKKKLCCLAAFPLLLACAAHAADEFILSYWCGPPETVKDLNKAYKDVAACGFNYAMVPCSGTTVKGNKAILDACKKSNLKYFLGDSRLMAAGPQSPALATNLNAVISEYAK